MSAFFYPFGYFIFVFFAHLLLPFHKKIRQGVLGRYKALWNLHTLIVLSDRKVIWFHVASSGEFEQLLPILDLLKETPLSPYVFVTYYSPSGKRSVQLETVRRQKAKKNIPWDFADYSPFDFKFIVKRVIQKIRPSAFVAIHREIWPSILMECKNAEIPCFLFSAYFPASNSKMFWKYAPWMKYFKMIGTVDEQSVEFLKSKMPVIQAEKLGDSRIERVVSRRKLQSSPPPYASFFENQKVIVLGSVWPKDFENILKAMPLHKDKRFVFVPHEPRDEFSNHMIEALKKQGLRARLWSRWLLDPDSTSQLIYDRIGGLFELYSIAHVAFVGGSFVKRVHNVLEPAAFGLPILTGPLIENSREAKELCRSAGLFRCEDGSAIASGLTLLDQKDQYQIAHNNVNKFILEGLGASKRYVELLV